MGVHFWAVLVLFSALIAWSVWVRICNLRAVDPAKVKSTPFSAAVQELVATAGGVYLSLIALVSFLRLDVPEKVTLGVSFDPLALLAICVAVTQPWWRRLFPTDIE
jgi:hypothetical protein